MSPQPIDLPLRPVALQGVPAPGYSAVDLRRMALAGQAQEGVIGAGDFKVTQRAAGAGLAVDVAAGEALVQGDSIANQGLYYTLLAAAATGAGELTVRAGDAQPRIDQVVLQIFDTQHDGSGLNLARLRIIEGTPTAGATLDNRLGAAALPSSCVRLAEYRMTIAAGSVPTAEIRDRRPWARGAFNRILRGTADYVTATSTPFGPIDAVNLAPRVECSGVPVRVKLNGIAKHSIANNWLALSLQVDGTVPDGSTGTLAQWVPSTTVAIGATLLDWTFTPAPGTHVIRPAWVTQAASATLSATNPPLSFVVEEIVRQNADNS